MIKKIITTVAALSLGVSTVTYAASAPTVFPHGIASGSAIKSTDGTTQAILTPNVANGVAGLDANGNVTAPVNTTGIINSQNKPTTSQSAIYNGELDSPSSPLGDIIRVGRSTFTSMIDGAPIMRVSGAHRQANPSGEDTWTDPDGLVIGGMAQGRGSHIISTCQDEGGMNLGACMSIWNSNDDYGGNRPGISPTTGEQMAGYGTFDAVVMDNGTKSTSPKIVASSSFNSSDGVSRSVYFTSGSVYMYPVLSANDRAKLKQHQNIISNVSTPSYVNRTDGYGTYAVNGFSGMLINWEFDVACPSDFKSGSCDRLDVDTWVIPGSGNSTTSNPQSYATTSSNLDTHYDASATSPAIYIGARTKQFNNLLTCELGDYDSDPSGAGAGSQHSLTRECENGEYDDELHTAISGKYHFNGLTIGVDSHTKGTQWIDGTAQTDGYNAWPDKSSWGIYLGGQLPNLIVLNPFTSDFVMSITGNTLNVTNPVSAGSSPGDTALYSSEFKKAGTTSMMFNQWQQCDAATGGTCTDHGSMSWREGIRVNGEIGSLTSGAPGAYVKYSGSGNYSICTASDVCSIMGTGGDWEFPNSITVNNDINLTNNLIFKNLSGDISTYLSLNSSGDLTTQHGAGGTGNFTVNGILTANGLSSSGFSSFSGGMSSTYMNTDGIGSNSTGNVTFTTKAIFTKPIVVSLGTPSSSTSACTAGQFQDDENYHYVCVSDNKWKRIPLETW